jgi:hypothetical protein
MFAFLGMEVMVVAFCTLISQLEGYPGLGDLATLIVAMTAIFTYVLCIEDSLASADCLLEDGHFLS